MKAGERIITRVSKERSVHHQRDKVNPADRKKKGDIQGGRFLESYEQNL